MGGPRGAQTRQTHTHTHTSALSSNISSRKAESWARMPCSSRCLRTRTHERESACAQHRHGKDLNGCITYMHMRFRHGMTCLMPGQAPMRPSIMHAAWHLRNREEKTPVSFFPSFFLSFFLSFFFFALFFLVVLSFEKVRKPSRCRRKLSNKGRVSSTYIQAALVRHGGCQRISNSLVLLVPADVMAQARTLPGPGGEGVERYTTDSGERNEATKGLNILGKPCRETPTAGHDLFTEKFFINLMIHTGYETE